MADKVNEEKVFFGEEYYRAFDTDVYLHNNFATIQEWHSDILKSLHQFYQSTYGTTPPSLKVLDFGAGPTIAYHVSSSLYASEIVLAEYVEENRKALRLWLDRNPQAFNWTPYFKYAVQDLERKCEGEVAERQERLRKGIKAVVSCDITKDHIIEKGNEGPYDIVFSCLCIEVACATKDDYAAAILKLSKLIKPGGKIVLIVPIPKPEVKDQDFYRVGSKRFHCLIVDEDFVKSCLKQAGFCDIEINPLPIHPQCRTQFMLYFVTAKTHK